jgi:hypothetical protein
MSKTKQELIGAGLALLLCAINPVLAIAGFVVASFFIYLG